MGDRDDDLAALRAVLDGVVEQVVYHPPQAAGVPFADRWLVRSLHTELLVRDRRPELRHGLAHELDEVDRPQRQLQRAAQLRLRHVEQLVHQAGRPGGDGLPEEARVLDRQGGAAGQHFQYPVIGSKSCDPIGARFR